MDTTGFGEKYGHTPHFEDHDVTAGQHLYQQFLRSQLKEKMRRQLVKDRLHLLSNGAVPLGS